MINSRIPGFYKLTPAERRNIVCEESNISDTSIFDASSLSLENASIMVENTIGTFAMPLATAVNFQCNGEDVLIPMVIEEPSVVAALSNMAQLTRKAGGFFAESDKSIHSENFVAKGDLRHNHLLVTKEVSTKLAKYRQKN